MARAKFTSLETAITGKQGGQSIAYGRNGFTLRNTTQPPITASTKQSYQRLITGSLWQLYSTLSPAQKTAWSTESINYPWVDSLGNARTRTGFETFSFCNQNLLILGLPFLTDPATFAGIVKPVVNVVSTSETTFVIQSANTNANQEYAVFVQLFQSVGRSSIQPNKILIVNLTAAQLSAGYNLVPDYSAVIPTPQSIYSAIIKVVAINVNNGNRDLDGVIVRQLVDPTGLGLDILSYYPFNGNANDYFGNNNPIYTGTTFDNNGVVNGQALFSGAAGSYINLGNNSSLDFSDAMQAYPFTCCFWVKTSASAYARLISKVSITSNNAPCAYQYGTNNGVGFGSVFDAVFQKRLAFNRNNAYTGGTYNFYAMTYDGNTGFTMYFNDIVYTNDVSTGAFVRLKPIANDLYIGAAEWSSAFNLNGAMSELTFFNQELTASELEIIRQANLAGQTIIDIN